MAAKKINKICDSLYSRIRFSTAGYHAPGTSLAAIARGFLLLK